MYATACLGELRLLDSYGLPRTEPDAFLWQPTAKASHRASMLRPIGEAGTILSLRHGYRRMTYRAMRGIQAAIEAQTHGLAWFQS